MFFVDGERLGCSCAAVCCLIVCHGGSLHVPELLIWVGAWHATATVGGMLAWMRQSWIGIVQKTPHRFNPDYGRRLCLSPSLPLFLPPLLAFSLFLPPAALSPLTSHHSIKTLKPIPTPPQKKNLNEKNPHAATGWSVAMVTPVSLPVILFRIF